MKQIVLLVCLLSLCTSLSFAQKIVEGRITDIESGDALPDATVMEKTPNGHSTKTDANGVFKISLSGKTTTLIVSAAGFNKREVAIEEGKKLMIGLTEQSLLGGEKVVVIGSRDQTRTASESAAAVDIIPIAEVVNQTGQVELNQILNFVAPSFNAHRMSGQDLADHVDPSSLRGMGPDQVLFLVNGKRYHSSAVINIFGTRGRGNAGTDLNSIPASAVERIEILRDGAAAQYGSDAVAGVVNIVLKSNIEGTLASVNVGGHATGFGPSLNYEGVGQILPKTVDGQNMNVAITHGTKIGKMNLMLSGSFLSKGATQRTNNTTAFFEEDYRSKGGEAAYNSASLYYNLTLPTQKGEFYASGGYNRRNTTSYIWNIPFEDSTRNVYEIYKEAYNPQIVTAIDNFTTTAGFKTKFGSWLADFSQTVGLNHVHAGTQNTLNPSLGVKSPTEFHSGDLAFFQNTTDIDFSRKFDKVLQGLNVAFGAELRHERFEIEDGDEASWKTYSNPPFQITNPDGTKSWVTKVGTSQGFPGFRPEYAVSANRINLGGYLDAELSVTKAFLVAGAVRFENYSDFGSTFGGKLAARYTISPKVYVRGSIQSGFRAPSLAQVYFQSTVNDVDGDGNNFEKVILNSKSDLTKRLGIPQLKAETSTNQSFGVVVTPNDNFSFAIDGYRVAVKDRIILTGTFKDNDNLIGADLKALNVIAGQFFTNALDTRTMGLDVTARWKGHLGNGKINVTLGGNINKMEFVGLQTIDKLKGKEDIYLSPREVQFILSSAPNMKFFTMADYRIGKLGIVLRNTVFGATTLIGTDGVLGFDPALDQKYYSSARKPEWLEEVGDYYKPRMVTDLIFNYDMTRKIKLSAGGNNIFDVYPTIQNSGQTDGGLMWDSVQMGQSGAYFFGKLTYQF
jgi:iron complex outermembrane recepter protein